ncbi:MAG: hypothetical protein HDT18_04560 [Oscillibacter sp.]|nr:hypothetical protein [Oscillibacter sp.]
MEKKKGTQSWTILDELQEKIEAYIPKKQRDPNKHYQKASGQGRPPAVREPHPQNLCLDAGHTGRVQSIEVRQYTAHIQPRGDERKEIERNSDFKARRWVVEATHSF